MSGKGKGKGKAKRKDEGKGKGKENSKTRAYSTDFNEKRIDLKRFAYDVIKYTALKFHVPESCIGVYDGSPNDYGCDDLCFYVGRMVIECQLAHRWQFHTTFAEHYKENNLATPKLIARLMQVVIKDALAEAMNPLEGLELSLAVLCELFLFLYTKEVRFCMTQLTKHWFECDLYITKKKFEVAGGLDFFYSLGKYPKYEERDVVTNKFIEDHCIPYERNAENAELSEMYFDAMDQSRDPQQSLSARENEDNEDALKYAMGIFDRLPMSLIKLKSPKRLPAKLKSPKRDIPKLKLDPEVSLPQNPGLGVPNPHEMYDVHPVAAAAEPSQNLPEESAEEQARRAKRAAYLEKKRSRKPSNRTSVDQRLRQLSLDPSGTTGQPSMHNPSGSTTQSYERLGARLKVPVRDTKPSVTREGKSSSDEE